MLDINWERYLLPRVSALVIWSIVSRCVSDEKFGVIAQESRMLSVSIFFNLLYRRAQIKLYLGALLFFFFFFFSLIVTCGRKYPKRLLLPPLSRRNLKWSHRERTYHIYSHFIHLRYNEMPGKPFKWLWKNHELASLFFFSELTWN